MVVFQNDPFREFDAVFDRLSGRSRAAGGSVPMDAYRRGDDVWVHLDLPGVSAESIDITLERNVLTVTAERNWSRQDDDKLYVAERRRGRFSRQVHLGDSLDGDAIEAEAWAYMAARSLAGLPLTFPGTTGVSKPLCGGVLYKGR